MPVWASGNADVVVEDLGNGQTRVLFDGHELRGVAQMNLSQRAGDVVRLELEVYPSSVTHRKAAATSRGVTITNYCARCGEATRPGLLDPLGVCDQCEPDAADPRDVVAELEERGLWGCSDGGEHDWVDASTVGEPSQHRLCARCDARQSYRDAVGA